MTITFPKTFLWGTAASPHQTEGNNVNSDWWKWEKGKSGVACDSYHRYEEDFELCKKLNNNAVRLGIEWARVEPAKGIFNQNEIDHYKKVLQTARSKGLKTFVTLHHFSSPNWIWEQGGWHSFRTARLFAKYARKVAQELDEFIDVYLTINEPQVYSLQSYVLGIWPPNKKSYLLSFVNQLVFLLAHYLARKEIKETNNIAHVGIVKNIVYYRAKTKNILDRLAAWTLNKMNCDWFLFPIKHSMDLLGVNYYFTNEIDHLKHEDPQDPKSDLNWWLEPTGIYFILKNLRKYKIPLYITENGLADKEDKKRAWWIREVLKQCHKAIQEKVDLRGYFHWSLIDNYEWHQGFWPRFGLVEIDYANNLARKPRPSFFEYQKICKTGTIEW